MVVLEKEFGMTFTEEEKERIRGRSTELKGEGSQGVVEGLRKRGEAWEIRRGREWSRV